VEKGTGKQKLPGELTNLVGAEEKTRVGVYEEEVEKTNPELQEA
jgi:hypothetical protein